MHAIMLAAGSGRRLAGVTGDVPKCLLTLAGRSLLERHLEILAGAGVNRLTLVVGFEAARIERALKTLVPAVAPGLDVSTLFNPDFHQGSVLSCLTAHPALGDDNVLLMDADVLYDARIIERLLQTRHANCLLLDRDFEAGDEPVKLCIRDNRPVAFAKRLPEGLEYDTIGESVGFFRFTPAMMQRLMRQCAQYQDRHQGEAPHEDALRDLMLADPEAFGHEDVTGLAWIEIDFPEDIERASHRILPRMSTRKTDT